ncbi:MAG TPA: homocysteine S-methyltransferase family protein, partial [Candidatus Limnocylindrales bacterium]|nr:homocysteine S-methyltransferase family protein [Candidatus Limnocylindrales bacterium]
MPAPSAAVSAARRAFAERLAARPLLFDGAMGTLLFSRGIPQRASLDELVESRPELVGTIHREYIAAGADA